MSYWYEPKIEDMNITEDGKELHILLGNDDSGNIWASIDIQDLKDFLSPNQEKE